MSEPRVAGMPSQRSAIIRQGPDTWKIDETDERGVSEVKVRQKRDDDWTTDPTQPLEDQDPDE